MKELNLSNSIESDIKFIPSRFPDGQQQITILNQSINWSIEDPVLIKVSLTDWLQLEKLVCAVKSLKCLQINNIHLYVSYFVGARSDRQFEAGGNNYLRDVICPVINSLKFKSITVLDPHSDVLEGCLPTFTKYNLKKFDLIKFAFKDLYNTKEPNYQLMCPDVGAYKKIHAISEFLGYKGDILTCNKIRDSFGKITTTQVPYIDGTKDILLIDDICDGGRTFIEIGKEIKRKMEGFEQLNGSPGKIYLIVTHGIFSSGIRELCKYFDRIYTTNSYQEFSGFNENLIKILKVI